MNIEVQTWKHYTFYIAFGIVGIIIFIYYLSNTLVHYTTSQQFPINSFERFPLSILIFPAELFSFAFGLYFVYTLLTDRFRNQKPARLKKQSRVAVLIPVYNEPMQIVERTISAAMKLKWHGGIKIYLLDDSTGIHMREMNKLAAKCGFNHNTNKGTYNIIRRKGREGYKAGNINNAVLNYIEEDYFAILDSDQAPSSNFLLETMDYFSKPETGFVQTPQYFFNDGTPLERAARLGADVFFSGQCVSKARDGAMPFCGTNVILRTEAFRKVNGFSYYTSTEDLDLGIRLNDNGYHGVYVPKILVKGYAPADFKSFITQQYRWANGNLAILRESWLKILAGRNFSLKYQIHTFFTLGWWLIGMVSLIFIAVPIISLITGLGTHHTWLPGELFALLYAHVAMGIGLIYVSLHGRIKGHKVKLSDAILQYSLVTNSMFIYLRAAVNALLKRYVGFKRTNKTGQYSGYWDIRLNIFLSLICFSLSIYALFNAVSAPDIEGLRTYLPISIWLLFYSVMLSSSILLVGEKAELSLPVATTVPNPKGVTYEA